MFAADVAWAAGIFEGEGTFGVNTASGQRLIATLQMTDEDVVRRFAETVGVGRVYGPYNYQQNDGFVRKPTWRWTAGSFEHAQAFLAMVWPWLGLRRKAHIREVLAAYPCTCHPGRRGRHQVGCGVRG